MSGSSEPSVAARDELAGVVDLFGALTREELATAIDELAFKAGADADEAAIDAAIETAIQEYYLVEFDGDATAISADADATALGTDAADADDPGEYLAVGPAAFPTLPEHAADLPHILDVEERAIDREPLAETVRDRVADEAEAVLSDGERDDTPRGDEARIEDLLGVCYDLESWAPVGTEEIRDRLTSAEN